MSIETILQKTPRADFFAVFPSGFYIFLLFSIYVIYDGSQKSLWGVLRELSDLITDHPSDLIIMVFAAYLFGSIVRSFPVDWAEKMVRPFDKNEFPYSDDLKDIVDELSKNAKEVGVDKGKLPKLSKGVNKQIYNYWKDVVCLNASEAFDYYLSYESRVRFFAGMFFSGIVGLLVGFLLVIVSGSYLSPVVWQVVLLSMFIVISFGYELKRVRSQEAKMLLMLFISYLQEH